MTPKDLEAWRAWVDLCSDMYFTYPMRTWARSMEAVSSPAYLYWFTWEPPVPESETYKAFHAGEIGYVFGMLDLFGATPTDADSAFSETISDIWVRFATTGDPNGSGFPEWPVFTRNNEAYLELGENIGSGDHLRMEQLELIEEVFSERRAASEPVTSTER